MSDKESEEKKVDEVKSEVDPKEQQERLAKFTEKYGELVKEYEADFAAYPVFVPDGKGGFRVVIQMTPVDMRGRPTDPVKSPFIPQ